MIEIKNVTKSYPLKGFRRHVVYRNFSLTLPERTNVAIIGRNGVGKSTLLRLIGGVEYPDSGKIEIKGSVSPPMGLTGGFAQNIAGRDNALFICRVCGVSGKDLDDRMAFIEKFADIGKFFEYPVRKYSSGMRARLAFAISMAFQYDYYLIDEITGAGDERFRARTKSAFEQIRGRGSIIMVSHGAEQLLQVCELGVYLHQGELRYFGPVREALAAYKQDNKEYRQDSKNDGRESRGE